MRPLGGLLEQMSPHYFETLRYAAAAETDAEAIGWCVGQRGSIDARRQ